MSDKKAKVVIVEDNVFQRVYFENMLSRAAGFVLTGSYASGREAMEDFPKTEPDVMLLDIHLDDACGIELLAGIKQMWPGLRIMICTADDHEEMIYRALVSGADAYVLKSSEEDQILSSLEQLYKGEICLSGVVAKKLIERLRRGAGADTACLNSLSKRQVEIMGLLIKGMFYKEIAVQLSISVETVRKHVHHIYKKLGVGNRLEAYNKLVNKEYA